MGMYDKAPNFGETFNPGDRMVLLGARYEGQIDTVHGKAEKSVFQIVSRNHPDRKVEYSCLGAGFARLAKQATAGDFPHVAEYVKVPTGKGDNEVKLFAPVAIGPREFLNGEDGPAAQLPDVPLPSADSDSEAEALGF